MADINDHVYSAETSFQIHVDVQVDQDSSKGLTLPDMARRGLQALIEAMTSDGACTVTVELKGKWHGFHQVHVPNAETLGLMRQALEPANPNDSVRVAPVIGYDGSSRPNPKPHVVRHSDNPNRIRVWDRDRDERYGWATLTDCVFDGETHNG